MKCAIKFGVLVDKSPLRYMNPTHVIVKDKLNRLLLLGNKID